MSEKVQQPIARPQQAGPAARYVNGSDRAQDGLKRYRVRVDAPHGAAPIRYVLASGPDVAREFYREAEKITGLHWLGKRDEAGKPLEEPALILVRELPD